MDQRGLFLDAGQARELLDIYHQGEYTKVSGSEIRNVEEVEGATDAHIKAILDALGPLPKSGKPLRVVLDSCNGAGSLVGPKLLEALGAIAIPINVTPDGSFPRPAEPIAENLVALCDAVRNTKRTCGLAQDMDADRLAIVSAEAEPIGEDYTLALAALYVLQRERGPIVANLSTTSALDDIAGQFGCPVFSHEDRRSERHDGVRQHNAVIGGEGNGGVIYPRINFGRDSLVGMALVLHLLAESGKSVSELLETFPHYSIVKEKMDCSSQRIPGVLRMLRQGVHKVPDRYARWRQGHVPRWLVSGARLNAEPIVRVVAEARSEEKARKMLRCLRAGNELDRG